MAAVSAPFGLKPIKLIGNRPFAGATNQYPIASAYAADLFVGDIVSVVTAGTIQKVTTLGTAASQFPQGTAGVFVGCSYTNPSTKQPVYSQQWPSGTVAADALAYVADDPAIVFLAQANGALPQTALGSNIGVVQTAGNATTGISKMTLDTTSLAVTATVGLRVVGFDTTVGNTVGDAFTNAYVIFTPAVNHFLGSATGI